MIIKNFETGEEGAFLTWIQVYDLLVYEILELPTDQEDFKWKVEAVMLEYDLERDSLDGIRYVFATVGAEYLGLSIEESDKVYKRLLSFVHSQCASNTIEDLDNCTSLDFFRQAVKWKLVDCKHIGSSASTLSLDAP